jgi:hypothetical protein
VVVAQVAGQVPLQRGLPIQAVAVVVDIALHLEPQAVQALSFFATPAQFNISLVAQ